MPAPRIMLAAVGLFISYTIGAVSQTLSEKRDAAMQIMVIATFSQECSNIEPDFDFVRRSYRALNVDSEEMSKDAKSIIIMAYTLTNLKKNKDQNCAIVWDEFGESGASLPGLVRRK